MGDRCSDDNLSLLRNHVGLNIERKDGGPVLVPAGRLPVHPDAIFQLYNGISLMTRHQLSCPDERQEDQQCEQSLSSNEILPMHSVVRSRIRRSIDFTERSGLECSGPQRVPPRTRLRLLALWERSDTTIGRIRHRPLYFMVDKLVILGQRQRRSGSKLQFADPVALQPTRTWISTAQISGGYRWKLLRRCY